jgi:predicted DNA-binding transcriptional regulator YafY
MKLAEDLDARARTRSSPTDLPPRKAISCALTLGTRIDAAIFTTVLFACRRKQLRIQYASPWTPPVDPIPTQIIEPWALRIMGGGIYLRAWSHKSQHAKTYRLAHVESVEIDPALPTEISPTDLWDDAHPAFGIDDDRPDVAVIRLRGGVARHVAKSIWHPSERDRWIGEGHEVVVAALVMVASVVRPLGLGLEPVGARAAFVGRHLAIPLPRGADLLIPIRCN